MNVRSQETILLHRKPLADRVEKTYHDIGDLRLLLFELLDELAVLRGVCAFLRNALFWCLRILLGGGLSLVIGVKTSGESSPAHGRVSHWRSCDCSR